MNPDSGFMAEAYLAALAAVGNSDPNPAVGAVVVSATGEILARGATQRAGFPHAERDALSQLPAIDLSAATLYVTLEPCCHHGRTPPCVDAIRDRKLRRVVIAERDFAAEVMGRSLKLLRDQGIDTQMTDDRMFRHAAWLTTGSFFFARKHRRPRITLKWAQTKDGALAPHSGPSGPISGKDAGFITAALRHFHKFTLASAGATRHDRPRLTARFAATPAMQDWGLSPYMRRLIELQPGLQKAATDPGQTYAKAAWRGFMHAGRELQVMQENIDPHFIIYNEDSIEAVLADILGRGFNSILIEAGPRFSEFLLREDFVDALAVYRSHTRTAHSLWGNSGRVSDVSRTLVSGTQLSGFELCENARLSEDDFLFYRRTER